MIRNLLVCGLIAGVCAGLLATGFAQVVGEPAVDAAIAFEERQAAGAPEESEPALVSRGVQSSVGLLAAAVVYGLSIGGLFALAFAFVYGRIGHASPAMTSLWLAGTAFVVVFLVPFLKYPANPPAVGNPETIDRRTALYFVMVAISLVASVVSLRIRRLLASRTSSALAALVAVGSYLAVVVASGLALPGVHEVPSTFPAVTLWEFREATVGMQLVLWAVLGLIFAFAAQRELTRAGQRARSPAAAAAVPAGD